MSSSSGPNAEAAYQASQGNNSSSGTIMYIPGIGNVNVGNNVQSGLDAGGQIVPSMDTPTPTYAEGTYTGNGKFSGNTYSGYTGNSNGSNYVNGSYVGNSNGSNYVNGSYVGNSNNNNIYGNQNSKNNKNSISKNYVYTYEPLKSSFSNNNDFYAASNAYYLSLLNPYNLPGTTNSDGTQYSYVHIPEQGKSHSQDLIKDPTYTVDQNGNIVRTDYTQSGTVNTTIPNLGGWRKTADGSSDPEVGDAYSRQISPYAFTTVFRRGEQIGTTPSWYNPNDTQSWLEKALAVTRGEGDYTSLLPGSDWYNLSNTTGSSDSDSSYGYGSNVSNSAVNNTTSLETSLVADRARALANMLGNNMATSTPSYLLSDADYEAQLRKSYGDAYVNALLPEQKAAIIAAMRYLKGGI